jgi:Fic family protein
MLVGTGSEMLYKLGWGKRVSLGEFRSAPIAVRSDPMRIFPYPAEVAACMERFVNWRDDCHTSQQLHQLILATHLFVYFCHIHPFPDGNGRVGRALMADYMVRQGYMPVVFVSMDRKDYLRMVSNAQDAVGLIRAASYWRVTNPRPGRNSSLLPVTADFDNAYSG